MAERALYDAHVDRVYLSRQARESEPDLKERLARAVDELPEGCRVAFLMHDLEGYTHEEIGAALGTSEGTSKSQLSRARAKARVAFFPRFYSELNLSP